jgi:hypothetical protein
MRFDRNSQKQIFITDKININDIIEINEKNYKLKGIVVRTGGSTGGGHYYYIQRFYNAKYKKLNENVETVITNSKDSNGIFVKFNDDGVNVIPEVVINNGLVDFNDEEVNKEVTENNYLCLYEHEDQIDYKTVHTFREKEKTSVVSSSDETIQSFFDKFLENEKDRLKTNISNLKFEENKDMLKDSLKNYIMDNYNVKQNSKEIDISNKDYENKIKQLIDQVFNIINNDALTKDQNIASIVENIVFNLRDNGYDLTAKEKETPTDSAKQTEEKNETVSDVGENPSATGKSSATAENNTPKSPATGGAKTRSKRRGIRVKKTKRRVKK